MQQANTITGLQLELERVNDQNQTQDARLEELQIQNGILQYQREIDLNTIQDLRRQLEQCNQTIQNHEETMRRQEDHIHIL